MPKIKDATGNHRHSLFLDDEGSVWSSGLNESGCLGLGDTLGRRKPEKIENLPEIAAISSGRNFSVFLDIQGNIWTTGSNSQGCLGNHNARERLRPLQIQDMCSKVKTISSGDCHNVFISEKKHNCYRII